MNPLLLIGAGMCAGQLLLPGKPGTLVMSIGVLLMLVGMIAG